MFILNNHGVFKDVFLNRIQITFQDSVIVVSENYSIFFNERNERSTFQPMKLYQLSFTKCFRQTISINDNDEDAMLIRSGVSAVSKTPV